MQAYGADRLRLEGERIVLSSRLDKGWTPRAPKTLTSAEFPGTAVLWEDRYYEVVGAERLPQGVRYTLEPWRDEHVMRTSERYDAGSEAQRAENARKERERAGKRRAAVWLAPLAGHLPASVQEHIGSELGIIAPHLTLASVFLDFVIVVAIFVWMAGGLIGAMPKSDGWMVIAGYLVAESAVRFYLAFVQRRPIGSAPGLLLYVAWWFTLADRTRAISPFIYQKGWSVRSSDAPPDVAARDAFALREPLVTLLTPAEQARAAERFGYDWRHQSSKIAAMILVFAAIGVVSSLKTGAMLSLIVALILVVEQLWRLSVLRHRPSGSIFGIAARPFFRKLL